MAIQVKFADPDYGNVLREVLVSDLGYNGTAVGTFFKGSGVDKDSFHSAFGKDPEIAAFQSQGKDAGYWHLVEFGGGAGRGVRIAYQSAVDISTWVPDPVVAEYIPEDSRAVFEGMMRRMVQRCGLSPTLLPR